MVRLPLHQLPRVRGRLCFRTVFPEDLPEIEISRAGIFNIMVQNYGKFHIYTSSLLCTSSFTIPPSFRPDFQKNQRVFHKLVWFSLIGLRIYLSYAFFSETRLIVPIESSGIFYSNRDIRKA
jgi:hypothetical protein